MNCNEIQDRIINGIPLTDEERRHTAECADCAALQRTIEAVTPRSAIRPSAGLRERILAAAEPAAKPARTRRPGRIVRLFSSFAAAAAVITVAVTLSLRTPAHAARRYFEQAITTISGLQSLRMELRIRTVPHENFAYTNPSLDFVPHTITVEYGDTLRWRVDKGGRVALNDGRTIRLWWPERHEGFFFPGGAHGGSGVIEELGMLLDPRRLLLEEQRLASHTKGAKYEIAEEGNTVRLTVVMPAQGDYSQSDYALNSSIGETHTLREYRFDKANGRLTAVQITALLPDGHRIVLLESDRIVYNDPVDRTALTALPEGIAWSDFSASAPHRLVDIPAREAAMRVLQAMGSWDRQLLDDALHLYGPGSCELLKKHYKGLSVVSVKKEVRSGNYAGVFVPCEVLLADGSAQTLMLALRRDNPEKAWLVDGGL